MLRYSTGDPCSQESRTAWEGRVYPGISQSEFRRLFLSGETGSWGIPTVRHLSSYVPTLWGVMSVTSLPKPSLYSERLRSIIILTANRGCAGLTARLTPGQTGSNTALR